jgi:hypothetical protein
VAGTTAPPVAARPLREVLASPREAAEDSGRNGAGAPAESRATHVQQAEPPSGQALPRVRAEGLGGDSARSVAPSYGAAPAHPSSASGSHGTNVTPPEQRAVVTPAEGSHRLEPGAPRALPFARTLDEPAVVAIVRREVEAGVSRGGVAASSQREAARVASAALPRSPATPEPRRRPQGVDAAATLRSLRELSEREAFRTGRVRR